MEKRKYAKSLAQKARKASLELIKSSPSLRKKALLNAASILNSQRSLITRENSKDIRAGKKAGLSAAMLDRLTLDTKRVNAMIKGLKEITQKPEVLGRVIEKKKRPSGINVSRVSVPIGSIVIIYESRPNVTIDSAALCVKSGNSVILRGGSEAFYSNRILCTIMQRALKKAGINPYTVQLAGTKDRTLLKYLLKDAENLDLVIPRGGEGLIRSVAEQSHIPVLKHYKGVCHVYIDNQADLKKAERIALNAKIQRPGVCNAMETLIIGKKLPRRFITGLLKKLQEKSVILYGDTFSRKLIKKIRSAKESDWYAEYLDLRLAVKSVENMEQAILHINRYGSRHTDAIVTGNRKRAMEFIKRVDSSSVMWNVSTRFSDGGEYGMGAEIGISTDKLHARGPMGARDLTTYKWVVTGTGQIRT
jgi:glutamate-5-semialdehyde dehydrogenase